MAKEEIYEVLIKDQKKSLNLEDVRKLYKQLARILAHAGTANNNK